MSRRWMHVVWSVCGKYFGWTYGLNSYGTYQWSFIRNKTLKQRYLDNRRPLTGAKTNVISSQARSMLL